MKNLLIMLGLVATTQSFAVTQSVDAEVEFVAPISMSVSNALQFGLISTDALAYPRLRIRDSVNSLRTLTRFNLS